MDNNLDILYKNPQKFVENIKRKTSLWMKKLNTIIGLTSFLIALSCLGTNCPQFYAWIGISIIFILQYSIRHFFPEEIKLLRQKENKNDFEEVILKGIEAHFFGIRETFKEAPIFWIGFSFLFLVAVGFIPKIAPKIESIIK
ncbi:MAG: hypothetical protein LWW94_11295 [Candidatus Desulfofervidaceae bacterium]|nr:hypothetical protein [Candidatus Desulfofervidaceae bacterium]